MGKHAELPASSAYRWMACAGSPRASEGVSVPATVYAMEGTAAHDLADRCLVQNRQAEEFVGDTIYVDPAGGACLHVTPKSPDDWQAFEVDQDFADAVDVYLCDIRYQLEQASFFEDVELRTEVYLDMAWLHPKLGGTADAHFIADGWIHLWDLKFGRGVIVEVKDNCQLKTYAVGILHEYRAKGLALKGVRMTVVQPRAPHADGAIRREEYTVAELDEFAKELLAAAHATEAPDAPVVAGDHCGFCPAKMTCEAVAKMANEVAGAEFAAEPDEFTSLAPTTNTEALGRYMRWIPILDAWMRDVEGCVQRELLHGREVEGFKLVRKRAHRKWKSTDSDTMVTALVVGGISKDDVFTPPKLKSPAQIEKMGKIAKALVMELAYKPDGGLTVARVDDPREAVVPGADAIAEFANAPARG